MFHKLHAVADILTANSFIKCCCHEISSTAEISCLDQ